MHCFAFGAKWGGRTANGFTPPAPAWAARRPSAWNNDAKANPPTPLAAVARKSRRVIWIISRSSIRSFTVEELIKVQEHLGHGNQCGRLGHLALVGSSFARRLLRGREILARQCEVLLIKLFEAVQLLPSRLARETKFKPVRDSLARALLSF